MGLRDDRYMVLYHESLHKIDQLKDELQRQRNAMDDARESLRKAQVAMTRGADKQYIVHAMIAAAAETLT